MASLAGTVALSLLFVAIGSMISAVWIAAARQQAEARAEESQERLVRLYVANGVQHTEKHDLMGSLSWFAEALRVDEGRAERGERLPAGQTAAAGHGASSSSYFRREEMHRRRLAAVFSQCPKLVRVWFHDDSVNYAEFSPDGGRVVTASSDGTARVWDVATGEPVTPPLQHSPDAKPGEDWLASARRVVRHAAFSRDGRRVVTIGGETARVWDATSGQPITPPIPVGSWGDRAYFSPNGRRLVTIIHSESHMGAYVGHSRVWDASTGEPVTPPLQHPQDISSPPVQDAAWSPDGQRLITAGGDATARIWDASTGQLLAGPLRHGGPVQNVAFSPDGRRVVTCSYDGSRVWDATSGEPIGKPLGDGCKAAAFTPDGRAIVAWNGKNFEAWDAETGEYLHSPPLIPYPALAMLSPDGMLVATTEQDGAVTIRMTEQANRDEPLLPILDHRLHVWRVAFSPDGRYLLTACADGAARLWDIAIAQPVALPIEIRGYANPIDPRSFSADQHYVVVTERDQERDRPDDRGFRHQRVRVWDLAPGVAVGPPLEHPFHDQLHAALTLDGRLVVTASDAGTVRVWDATTGELRREFEHGTGVMRASLSPDSRRLVTSAADGTVRVWDVATGRLDMPPVRPSEQDPLPGTQPVWHVQFSPDGRTVLSAGLRGARLWDVATGKLVGAPIEAEQWFAAASFSPDGRSILTQAGDNSARVWDTATGQPRTPPLKHNETLSIAAFSPDGRRVVTASWDSTARVWDASTGAPITPPLRHGGIVYWASFSPDGSRVVTASSDETARVWDATTGEPVTPPLKHTSGVGYAAFAPDGRRVVTASENLGAVWHWELPIDDRPVEDWVTLAQLYSGHQIDTSGGYVPIDSAALRHAWGAVHARRGQDQDSAVSERLLAWHRQFADRAEQARRWAAAGWHLDPLIDGQPPRWQLHARRARAYAGMNQRDRADADYARSIELGGETALAWHNQAAQSSEGTWGQFDISLWYLNRLIELKPDDWQLRVRRARVYIESADWTRAAEEFARARELGADETRDWFDLAFVQLAGGDTNGYRDTCLRLVDRFGETDDPWLANNLAWRCAATPDSGIDAASLLPLAEKAVAANPKSYFLNTFGAVLYRAGQFEAAIEKLNAAVALSEDRQGSVENWLLLAMAHRRLGQNAEARPWLTKAERWLQPSADEEGSETTSQRNLTEVILDRRFLLREARELLKSD